jgi:hypothetical protein
MSELAATAGPNDSADCTADQDARRAKERFPLSTVFQITPLDRDRQPVRTKAFVAIGKDLSTTGLCISHVEPMECCRVVITTSGTSAAQFCVEAEVAWTRPSITGLHETGFRFVRKLS